MPRYTVAYNQYVKRLTEVEILLRRSRFLERRSPIDSRNEINANCRAAIVLLSSHLEGYIKDISEIALDRIFVDQVPRNALSARFFYSISKDRFDELRNTSDPSAFGEKVFSFLDADGPFWGQTGPFPNAIPTDRFIKGFASPSLKKIAKFFKNFGYDDFKVDVSRALGPDTSAVLNMLENVVATRNDIAHGDSSVIRTPSDVLQMVSMLRYFGRVTDDAFASWCRSNLCSIRR
ncbi:MAG: MAE_28990/MAE_18760 family HEPN-like nuclease [Rhodobacter sp.]|nr:MAE_28990/MAE_18760 family HEPN-like nuclease [Rhodobacter sp.]